MNELIDKIQKESKIANIILNKDILLNFSSGLLAKPFILFAGLSGSGKTLLSHFFSKWISVKNGRNFLLINNLLQNQSFKNKYELIFQSNYYLEIINKNGNTKKIIPLPIPLLKEWYFAFKCGEINIDTNIKEARDKVGSNSIYQKYQHGFYNDYFYISKILYQSTIEENIKSLIPEEKEILIRKNEQYELISVGANWTSKDDLLGYPDALNDGVFVKKPALDLLLRASQDLSKPYFLILDEMNLSHVERYFSDFLSAMESGGDITLHEDADDRDGVPPSIKIPKNFFIIGTVNVDETTYMFSPKVLDRANVIEFKAESDQILDFLEHASDINLENIAGQGSEFGESFVEEANKKLGLNINLNDTDKEYLKSELEILFAILAENESEFGFRTAKEITRFVYFHKLLTNNDNWEIKDAIDAQIMQKILPKLHGSQKKLRPILLALGQFCYTETHDNDKWLDNFDKDYKCKNSKDFYYPTSLEKILRMLRKVQRDGFASFAEA